MRMATAAVQLDEEALIREFIATIALPTGVKFKRVDQVSDFAGDPALGIFFSVSMKLPLSKKRVNDLSDLKNAVQEKVFQAKISKWPFVRFLEEKA